MSAKTIRFTSNARDGFSWVKNEQGTITQTLAEKPQATSDIYIIQRTKTGDLVWATSEDVELWNQISLF